ncbi:Formylglycine-generating enzyme, required for sulfatase activity, contains SUMF1/FGE domain [Candidatus Electronema halotolerans]
MIWQQKAGQPVSRGVTGLTLLLFILLAAMSAAAAAQPVLPDFGRYYALVIGNQSYRQLDELKTARADAKETARLLEEQYGFEVELLLDADRDRMLWTLSQLPKRISRQERDSLLIYYVGHSRLNRKNGAGWWLPVDADQDTDTDWIPTALISNLLDTVRARHILVVTDSCYSGNLQMPDDGLRRQESKEQRLRRLVETPSLTVLQSGGEQPVYETGDRNSLFARNFLHTLSVNRHLLSGRVLFERMVQPYFRAAEQLLEYGYLTGSEREQGDFIFAPKELQKMSRQPSAPPHKIAAQPLKKEPNLPPRKRVVQSAPEAPVEQLRPQKQAPAPQVPAAPPLPPPKKGDIMINELSGMELIYLPSGCFKMGSSINEKGRFAWEGPVHEVCVDGFWIGKYEVTQEQWQKIMGGNPSGFQKGGSYPVENVSWNDAQKFLNRMNKRSSRVYRLPTEAEWEYACRADSSGKYCGGDTPDFLAWHEENSGGITHPAGKLQANAFGLYDMSGNVWEWCSDRFDKNYYGLAGTRLNPQGPASGSENRVVRGGSAGSRVLNCRAAFRFRNKPDYRENLMGFRVVMQE